MKHFVLYFLSFFFSALFFSCSVTRKNEKRNPKHYEWSVKDTEEYANKNEDSTKWSKKKLTNDLKNAQQADIEVKLPISDYPSPVAEYSGNGSTVNPLSFKIKEKTVIGYTLAHYKDKFNEHLFADTAGQYYTFFTILFLTDKPLLDKGQNPAVISRNYPHYLFIGTQNTSLGNIDWVQATLGNGENFAIVTQRYFDLKAGRTILIAPLKDGSLRFLQIKDSPETYTWKELSSQSVMTINNFVKKIKINEKVISFFSQGKIIE
jgi:hypothetical protein